MAGPYIPPKDSDFDDWLSNFSTKLTASPGTYGMLAADAVAVASIYTVWHTAYLVAIAPSTRTPVTVQNKDNQKIAALVLVRPYAITISLNQGVLSSDKLAIGVNPRTTGPTPVGPPTTLPVLSLISATHLIHLLRYRDQDAPSTSRAKPPNVTQIQIYGAVSATVVSDPATLPLKTIATKVPVQISWDSGDVGKTAYYAARWQTRRGLAGPWSVISAIVVM